MADKSIRYLTNLNLKQNQLLNAVIHNHAGNPNLDEFPGIKGQLVYDTQNDQFFVHDGTKWVTVGDKYVISSSPLVGGGAKVTLTGDPVNTTEVEFGEGDNISISESEDTITISLVDDPIVDSISAGDIRIGVDGDNVISTTAKNLIIDSYGGTTTVKDNMIIEGDLTVEGTTTFIDTEHLLIEDNIITLNHGTQGEPTENAGIEIERGLQDKVFLLWDETYQKWTILDKKFSARTLELTVPDGTAPITTNSKTLVANLNADLLDGQEGTYYRSWTNTTDKPTPIIQLGGDLNGSVSLTNLASQTFTLNGYINENAVALGTDTTGNYVRTATGGTAIEVLGSGLESADITIRHADTSTLEGLQGGTGISSVTVDGLGHVTAVGTQYYMRRFSQDLSTPGLTSHVVQHNLNSRDVMVTVREINQPYAEVYTNIEYTDANTITLNFAVAPATNIYRVTVIG